MANYIAYSQIPHRNMHVVLANSSLNVKNKCKPITLPPYLLDDTILSAIRRDSVNFLESYFFQNPQYVNAYFYSEKCICLKPLSQRYYYMPLIVYAAQYEAINILFYLIKKKADFTRPYFVVEYDEIPQLSYLKITAHQRSPIMFLYKYLETMDINTFEGIYEVFYTVLNGSSGQQANRDEAERTLCHKCQTIVNGLTEGITVDYYSDEWEYFIHLIRKLPEKIATPREKQVLQVKKKFDKIKTMAENKNKEKNQQEQQKEENAKTEGAEEEEEEEEGKEEEGEEAEEEEEAAATASQKSQKSLKSQRSQRSEDNRSKSQQDDEKSQTVNKKDKDNESQTEKVSEAVQTMPIKKPTMEEESQEEEQRKLQQELREQQQDQTDQQSIEQNDKSEMSKTSQNEMMTNDQDRDKVETQSASQSTQEEPEITETNNKEIKDEEINEANDKAENNDNAQAKNDVSKTLDATASHTEQSEMTNPNSNIAKSGNKMPKAGGQPNDLKSPEKVNFSRKTSKRDANKPNHPTRKHSVAGQQKARKSITSTQLTQTQQRKMSNKEKSSNFEKNSNSLTATANTQDDRVNNEGKQMERDESDVTMTENSLSQAIEPREDNSK